MRVPDKKRLRRTMMFLNAQKPGLIKDPYIYRPDSIMLDLEDAVAENQKDAARYSLFHALREIDYRGCERHPACEAAAGSRRRSLPPPARRQAGTAASERTPGG